MRVYKSGEEHPSWKGDAATDHSKRGRARQAFPLGPCEVCGQPGIERHHRDENTGNNSPENVQIVCRSCHSAIHERGQRVGEKLKKPPVPCINCGREAKPTRKGRCGACDWWWRKHGIERPARLFGRERHAA